MWEMPVIAGRACCAEAIATERIRHAVKAMLRTMRAGRRDVMLPRCVCCSGCERRLPEARTNKLSVFRQIWDVVRAFVRMARSVSPNVAGYPRKLIQIGRA